MGNKTVNYTFTETEGKSRSTSHTTNSSESETETTSSGSSITNGESKESVAGKTLKGISSAASIIGAALGPLTGGMSLAVGGVVAGGVGLLGNAVQKQYPIQQRLMNQFLIVLQKYPELVTVLQRVLITEHLNRKATQTVCRKE